MKYKLFLPIFIPLAVILAFSNSNAVYADEINDSSKSFLSNLRYSAETQFGAYYFSPETATDINRSGFQWNISGRAQKHFSFGELGTGLGLNLFKTSGAHQFNVASQSITQLSVSWTTFYSYELIREVTVGIALNQYIGAGTKQYFSKPKDFGWVFALAPYAQYNFKAKDHDLYAKLTFEQGLNIAGTHARTYSIGFGMYLGKPAPEPQNISSVPQSCPTATIPVQTPTPEKSPEPIERGPSSLAVSKTQKIPSTLVILQNKNWSRKKGSPMGENLGACKLLCPKGNLPCQVICDKEYIDFRRDVNSCNPR